MSAIQAEVFEAFLAIDVPEDKALRAAASHRLRASDRSARVAKRDEHSAGS